MKLSLAVVAVAAMALVSSASADIIVFDDAFSAGFANAQWDTYVVTEDAHSGTSSLRGAQASFNVNPNIALGTDTTLEFYVNAQATNANPYAGVKVTLSNNAELNFDSRGGTVSYVVEGQVVAAAGGNYWGATIDKDAGTWQKVSLDLTQQTWYGWPYTASQLLDGTTLIKKVAISTGGAYVDDIKFVPEPATMGVLALGGLLALRRRRA